jgi:DNA-binding SARP family transcriptional activator
MVSGAVTVRLLGRPVAERDGVACRPPRGRKAWALLAYLALAERPPGRGHLAHLLFGDADDPLGALRWTLAELRRTLGVTLTGDPVTIGGPLDIDVRRLVGGSDPSWVPDGPGELLEGLTLSGQAEFESWLVVQRHRLAALVESRLREAAANLLTAGRAAQAVPLAARAVACNPLDEGNHELLVRALAMSGDRAAAQRQVAVCVDLFRRELGVEPSEALTDAAYSGPATTAVPPVGGRRAALSQLEAGRAAILAGAVDAGVQCLRRAVAEAGEHGDAALRARCLCALGSALVHAVRGRDEEGAAVLREAVVLAAEAGDQAIAVEARRELGFVEVQAGRRAAGEAWLAEAASLARTDEERAAILGVRGMNASDSGDYAAAFVHLGESVEHARRAGDERQCAWSLALLGRAHLLRGERRQAEAVLGESLALVARQRWLAFQPWPQALRGELDLLGGDVAGATDHLEHAWSLACQLGDPCWEGMAARGLGLLHADRGEHAAASGWHSEATARCARLPDRYVWVLGHTLDGAITHAIDNHMYDRATPMVSTLAALAARGHMRELTVRAHLHRHRLGETAALGAARLLAEDIDNPALAALL